jgi:hypothetical protein
MGPPGPQKSEQSELFWGKENLVRVLGSPPDRNIASVASGERMRGIRFFLFQNFLFFQLSVRKKKSLGPPLFTHPIVIFAQSDLACPAISAPEWAGLSFYLNP